MELPDIQDSHDDRGIAIDEVGVANVRSPFNFRDGEISQSGVATVAVTVGLHREARGTHMSRMVQSIESILADLVPNELGAHLKNLAALLHAHDVRLSVEFPVALAVQAPATRIVSHQVSDVVLSASLHEEVVRLATSVTTDITTLCPCSQAVSDYGAHNQRSRVSVDVMGRGDDLYPMSVVDLFGLIRSVGSAPVVPVIKRADERHLTMQAFDRPAFVEDVVRDLSAALRQGSIPHRVESVNVESIHSHDAVARLAWPGGHNLKVDGARRSAAIIPT